VIATKYRGNNKYTFKMFAYAGTHEVDVAYYAICCCDAKFGSFFKTNQTVSENLRLHSIVGHSHYTFSLDG